MSFEDYQKATEDTPRSEEEESKKPQLYFLYLITNYSKKRKSRESSNIKIKVPDLKKPKVALSFQNDDSEEEEEAITIKPMKDPTVDTHFLPDAEREAKERERKLEEEKKQKEEIEKVKNETLMVSYKYWDGYGHKYDLNVTKGTSIFKFLILASKQLAPKFPAVKDMHPADLMFVKEDSIIPQEMTFFDLISSKADGKSGPLWRFGV